MEETTMSGSEVLLWTLVLLYLVFVGIRLIGTLGDFVGGGFAYIGARKSGDLAARTVARDAWLPSWRGFFREITVFMIVLLIVTTTGLVQWFASYLEALWLVMPKIDFAEITKNFPQP